MRWLPISALVALPLACSVRAPKETPGPAAEALTLSSLAFADGAPIPVAYTADGFDRSPPLAWTGVPPETRSLVLIMEDPDAPMGTWDHWVVYDIPAETRRLAEGAAVPGSARQGQNSWGRTGYGGPAPPPGKPHRYLFLLYALGERLGLDPGADKAAVRAAMAGKVLAEARLLGTYGR